MINRQIAVSRAKPTTTVAFLTKTFVRASGRAQMSVITSAEVLFVIALSVSSFKGCLLQSYEIFWRINLWRPE